MNNNHEQCSRKARICVLLVLHGLSGFSIECNKLSFLKLRVEITTVGQSHNIAYGDVVVGVMVIARRTCNL